MPRGDRAAGGFHAQVNPAEPDERARVAREALNERAAELRDAGTGEGAVPGETPTTEAAPVQIRDVERDKKSLAACVEVAAQGAARVFAWKWPQTALTAALVCSKAGEFARGVGEQFGAAAGMALPRALPALGGICGMVAWWLRSLPLPTPPADEPASEIPPARPEPTKPPKDGEW